MPSMKKIDIVVGKAAQKQLEEISDYYEEKSVGLSRKFRDDLQSKIRLIETQPRLFAIVYKSVRRFNLNKFPVAIFYT
ncbi:MAG: plasmid stabilization system protein ParE [Arenicella sp.]|jgi:plasmid stabilization system protein ParE